jgi:hypothetical protein
MLKRKELWILVAGVASVGTAVYWWKHRKENSLRLLDQLNLSHDDPVYRSIKHFLQELEYALLLFFSFLLLLCFVY